MRKYYQIPRTSVLNVEMTNVILADSGSTPGSGTGTEGNVFKVESGDYVGITYGGGAHGPARSKSVGFWDM